MIETKVIIKHKYGLHMRPAMIVTEEAAKFNCDIKIFKEDMEADAKSILQVTMLAATKGEEVTIRAEGDDEQEAVDTLKELIKSNFKDLLEVEK